MKKDEKKHISYVITSLIILLVLGSLFLVYIHNKRYSQLAFDYHGFNVVRTKEGYRFQIFINENKEPNYFTLRSDPRTVENISIEQKIATELLNKEQIYVVIDPYENLTGLTTMAALEIDKILENLFLFNIPVNTGFTKPYAKVNLTVVTCQEANATLGVIWLRLGEQTNIFSEHGCTIIEAEKEEDLLRAADRIILKLLNIF